MYISEHAVENCLERVMGLDDAQQASYKQEMKAKNLIQLALYSPEKVIKEKEDDAPIHINGDTAVPVKSDVIPTAYNSDNFISKTTP